MNRGQKVDYLSRSDANMFGIGTIAVMARRLGVHRRWRLTLIYISSSR